MPSATVLVSNAFASLIMADANELLALFLVGDPSANALTTKGDAYDLIANEGVQFAGYADDGSADALGPPADDNTTTATALDWAATAPDTPSAVPAFADDAYAAEGGTPACENAELADTDALAQPAYDSSTFADASAPPAYAVEEPEIIDLAASSPEPELSAGALDVCANDFANNALNETPAPAVDLGAPATANDNFADDTDEIDLDARTMQGLLLAEVNRYASNDRVARALANRDVAAVFSAVAIACSDTAAQEAELRANRQVSRPHMGHLQCG